MPVGILIQTDASACLEWEIVDGNDVEFPWLVIVLGEGRGEAEKEREIQPLDACCWNRTSHARNADLRHDLQCPHPRFESPNLFQLRLDIHVCTPIHQLARNVPGQLGLAQVAITRSVACIDGTVYLPVRSSHDTHGTFPTASPSSWRPALIFPRGSLPLRLGSSLARACWTSLRVTSPSVKRSFVAAAVVVGEAGRPRARRTRRTCPCKVKSDEDGCCCCKRWVSRQDIFTREEHGARGTTTRTL